MRAANGSDKSAQLNRLALALVTRHSTMRYVPKCHAGPNGVLGPIDASSEGSNEPAHCTGSP